MFKNARTIAIFTLISRVFGYLRDLVIASFFGASAYTDMFFIAFKIPNTLRRFLGEGAINSSIVPVLSKIDDRQKPKAIWNLIFWFGLLLLLVTFLGVVFSKFLVLIFAPGYLNSVLMNKLVKLNFPYIFFIGLTVLLMGILNSFKHFAVPAFAPTLLNLSIIASVYLLFNRLAQPVYALCIGVMLGGVFQLLISLIDFGLLKLPFEFSFRLEPTTIDVFKLMGITAIGSSIVQISSMADSFVASFLKSGSYSYIFYTNRLFQLPFAIFSIALAQSSLPDLSKMPKEELKSSVEVLSRFVVFYSSLVTVYFLFFSSDVVSLLFKHGRFSEVDVAHVSSALKIMILGFLFFSLSKVFSNVFYAQKDAKTPLKASIIASVSAIVLSFVLGFSFGFLGLAVSYAISGFVNCLALTYFLNRSCFSVRAKMFFDKIDLLSVISLFLVSLCLCKFSYGFLIASVPYALVLIYGYRHYSATFK